MIRQLPTARQIEQVRNKDIQLECTLNGQKPASQVSFDISELVSAPIRIDVCIPPEKVPTLLEKTVAKTEFDVVSEKVRAMLPAKASGGIADLDALEQQEKSDAESDSDEEDEQDNLDMLLADKNGDKKSKKKKRKSNDPLAEDSSQPVNFEFRQFTQVATQSFTKTQLDWCNF